MSDTPELLAKIASAERLNPSTITQESIPKTQGIYVWFLIGKTCPEYIGKAKGKAGLRQRIWNQ
jgi:hypothetical protein